MSQSRSTKTIIGAVATLAIAGSNGYAQTAEKQSKNWEITAGPAVFSVPKYLGAKDRRTLAIPFVEAKGPDGLFANVERGVGREIKIDESTRFAYSLALDLNSRRRKDDVRFSKLDDLQEAPAARVEIERDIGAFTLNATAQTRLQKSSSAGSILALEASYQLTEQRNFLVSAGLNAKFMDSRFARNFFGVSEAQAAASGLNRYAAGSGLFRAAPFVQVLARIDDNWTAFSRIEAGRLQNDAKDSPLVRQANGTLFVLSVSRSF